MRSYLFTSEVTGGSISQPLQRLFIQWGNQNKKGGGKSRNAVCTKQHL